MANPKSVPQWLVIDTRTAQSGVQSGVSRFVVGLTTALADRLSQSESLKLLLVSKSEPPAWVVELVHKYPQTVSFWSGGPGALTRKWEKPTYYWSTKVIRKISKFSSGQFLWLAPANFDRPLFSSSFFGSQNRDRVIQIVHDTIPLTQRNSMGFLFRTQFKFFVKRTLARFPNVLTVSQHSATELQRFCRKRTTPVSVLSNGVEGIFGSKKRPTSEAEQRTMRVEFLRSMLDVNASPTADAQLEKLAAMRWVMGVGRSQKYKGWEVAEEAITQCGSKIPQGVLFLRIGFEQRELSRFGKSEPKVFGQGLACSQVPMLAFPGVSDDTLVGFYQLSDALVHPSKAEGFGFPPLEAVLCGLPVLYRSGTAVDDHFAPGALPDHFWRPLSSDNAQDWAGHLVEVLSHDRFQSKFAKEMQMALSPRAYVEQIAGGKQFDWHTAADTFLAQILQVSAENPS